MKIRAHETFSIRKGWLHKGVKNVILYPRLFTNKELNPCDILGIGTNMVKALRYWLTATRIIEEANLGNQKIYALTSLGSLINRCDTYYEEEGTIWAIHYMLATNKELSTAWYWLFNIFKMSSFDKSIVVRELAEYLHTEFNYECSEKMLSDEFDCMIKTYCVKDSALSPENINICPLSELNLIVQTDGKWYKKNTPDKDSLHPLIVFGALCDQNSSDEILISDLMNAELNIARIFNFDRATCYFYLDELRKRGLISMSRTAGLDIIKVQHRMSFLDALNQYYTLISGGESA